MASWRCWPDADVVYEQCTQTVQMQLNKTLPIIAQINDGQRPTSSKNVPYTPPGTLTLKNNHQFQYIFNITIVRATASQLEENANNRAAGGRGGAGAQVCLLEN